jgi:hypothetical protein
MHGAVMGFRQPVLWKTGWHMVAWTKNGGWAVAMVVVDLIEGVKPSGYMWCLTLTFDMYFNWSLPSSCCDIGIDPRSHGLYVSYNL